MGTYAADPRDHEHADPAQVNVTSNPVPEKYIPWMVLAMGVALLLVVFTIPLGFMPR